MQPHTFQNRAPNRMAERPLWVPGLGEGSVLTECGREGGATDSPVDPAWSLETPLSSSTESRGPEEEERGPAQEEAEHRSSRR